MMIRRLAAVAFTLLIALVAIGAGHNSQAGVGVMRAMQGASQYVPTWSFDFRAGTAPAGSSFTRASSRSCINGSSVLVALSTNVACFDHDYLGAALGYLAEMQSTNSIANSAASWTPTNVSISTDGTLAPDGSTAAQKITASAGNANHYAGLARGSGVASSSSIGQSVFVKQGSTRYVVIVDPTDAVYHSATFDFQTGAWAAAGLNATTQPPRRLAGGWWRIGFLSTTTNANTGAVAVAPALTGAGGTGDFSYNAAGTETVYATGLQSETVGVGITSYIPTSGSAATRSADLLALPLASLPGWNASQGGVLVAAHRLYTIRPAGTQAAVSIGDAPGNNFFEVSSQSNGTNGIDMWSGGARQSQRGGGAPPLPFVRRKSAGGWGTARTQIAYDGALVTSGAGSYLLPASPTNYYFGAGGGADYLNGAIEGAAFYPGARSDAFVQQVSK